MHLIDSDREPDTTFTLHTNVDDQLDRRRANKAIAVSAIGLAITGVIELLIALLTGSVALLGDALHNLSDVSTSAIVFIGFRASRKAPTNRYPYGFERAEDLAGIGIAIVIWASAALAGYESVHKLLHHGGTRDIGWGIAGAALGIVGNQIVARYKLTVGKQINSATMISDAKHSWLDALSSGGALVGLVGVLAGWRPADAIAGIVVTFFICHVGWEVTTDVCHRLMDGVDSDVIVTAERAASEVAGVRHAHARARWTGRTLHVEIQAWIDAGTTFADSQVLGQHVADLVSSRITEMREFSWIPRVD